MNKHTLSEVTGNNAMKMKDVGMKAPDIEEIKTKVSGIHLLTSGLLTMIQGAGMPDNIDDALMVLDETFWSIEDKLELYMKMEKMKTEGE